MHPFSSLSQHRTGNITNRWVKVLVILKQINSNADNDALNHTAFAFNCRLGQNATDFAAVHINIVRPFDLRADAGQLFNSIYDSYGRQKGNGTDISYCDSMRAKQDRKIDASFFGRIKFSGEPSDTISLLGCNDYRAIRQIRRGFCVGIGGINDREITKVLSKSMGLQSFADFVF